MSGNDQYLCVTFDAKKLVPALRQQRLTAESIEKATWQELGAPGIHLTHHHYTFTGVPCVKFQPGDGDAHEPPHRAQDVFSVIARDPRAPRTFCKAVDHVREHGGNSGLAEVATDHLATVEFG